MPWQCFLTASNRSRGLSTRLGVRLDADVRQRIENEEGSLCCGDVGRAHSGYSGIVENGPDIGAAYDAGLRDIGWPIAGHGRKSLLKTCTGDVPVDLVTVAEYPDRPSERPDHLIREGKAGAGVKPLAGMLENSLPNFIHVESFWVYSGERPRCHMRFLISRRNCHRGDDLPPSNESMFRCWNERDRRLQGGDTTLRRLSAWDP